MEQKILNLTIKKKWFDMISSGEKREEYREIKPYWATRLLQLKEAMEPGVFDEMVCDMKKPFCRHSGPEDLTQFFGVRFKKFDKVSFRNGYAKNAPSVTVDCSGISIATGKAEWGAELGKYYFTVSLGPKRGQVQNGVRS